MKNEAKTFDVDFNENIYVAEDGKVYFQDKLPYTVLSNKEYKKILVRIVLKGVSLVV